MTFYDISRDTLSTPVYKGDPETEYDFVRSIDNGDMYNLSKVTICTHAGTHIDAPLHFDEDGNDIGKMKMTPFYGKCTVITVKGIITGEDMDRLVKRCRKRIIFHGSGETFLSESAAEVIAGAGVVLVGTDAQSIAPSFDEYKTHLNFARRNVAVLENLYLEGVKDGEYILSAFPVKLCGLEAAPCRAVLIEEDKGI